MPGQNTPGEGSLDKIILLVDNEKGITDLLEDVLRKGRYKAILKASSGAEAVHLCRVRTDISRSISIPKI